MLRARRNVTLANKKRRPANEKRRLANEKRRSANQKRRSANQKRRSANQKRRSANQKGFADKDEHDAENGSWRLPSNEDPRIPTFRGAGPRFSSKPDESSGRGRHLLERGSEIVCRV